MNAKILVKLTAVVMLLGLAVVAKLSAQNPARGPAPAAAPKIVVLDVNAVYKGYERFKQRMEQLNADLQAADAKLKEEYTRIQKLAEGLQDIKRDSPDYRTMEAQITADQAKFTADRQIQQKDFVEQKARLYYDTFREIKQEVSNFTRQYGIELVIQYSNEEVDENDYQSVLRRIGGSVIYENNLDITTQVLDRLNQRAGSLGANAAARNSNLRQGVAPRR